MQADICLSSQVGVLKPFMSQECRFNLFTSDRAVVQRKMLLASKCKLLPHITAALGGSLKADYKVPQHSQIMCRGSQQERAVSNRTVWCLPRKVSVWTCACGQKQASAWEFSRLQALRPVQSWIPCKEEIHWLANSGRAPAVHFLIFPSCKMPIWIFHVFFFKWEVRMEKIGNPLSLLGFKLCSSLVVFSSSLQGITLQPSLLLAGLWISHHPEGTAPILGK